MRQGSVRKVSWLVAHSSAKRVSPPIIDKRLPVAPGTYVMQK